jgi:hypothetical protein
VSRTGPRRIGPRRIGDRDWRRPLLPGNGPLARAHPALAFGAVLVVFAVGVWWGGAPGALLLGSLAFAVGALLAASWPRLSHPERAVRLMVLLVLIAIALHRWS